MKDHITFILVRSTNERFSKIVRTKHERCTPIRPHAFYENLHFRKLHFSLLQSAARTVLHGTGSSPGWTKSCRF